MEQSEDREQVERLRLFVAQLARRTGVEPPRLKVLPRSSERIVFRVTRDRHRQYTLEAATRIVSETTDAQLTGLIAHELQHIAHDDPQLPPVRRLATLIAVGSLALVVGVAVGAVFWRVVTATWLQLLALVLIVPPAFLSYLVALQRATSVTFALRRDGLRRPVVEVRDDLAAVQVVGRGPVLDALNWLASDEAAESKRGRFSQWLFDIQSPEATRTHPSPNERITAAQAYDVQEDPLSAAHRLLPGHVQRHPGRQ